MKLFLGIDIGGTKIASVLSDGAGRILFEDEFLIHETSKPAATIRELISRLKSKLGKKKVSAIGVGMPGPVDPQSGKIPWSPNLPDWEGFPISAALGRAWGVPVFIENDANVAALAEKKFGAGRGKKDLIYITVSTGVGGGLIVNGKLYAGHSFSGGEVGHTTVVPNGNLCHCGKRGCIEAHASGTAIAQAAEEAAQLYPRSLLGRRKAKNGTLKLTSRDVKEAALRGDRQAVAILEQAGKLLGITLGNLITLLNPEVIVLGGGVLKGKGSEFLWKAMTRSAEKESWPEPFRACKIVHTRFQDEVGALGAATLAMDITHPPCFASAPLSRGE